MRIFKFAFWLSAVVIFLPASNDNEPVAAGLNKTGAMQDVSTIAMTAISKTGGLTEFCSHQPELCSTAGNTAVKLAINGLNLAGSGAEAALAASPIDISKATKILAGSKSGASSNTLKLEDLIPDWKPPTKPSRS